MPRAFFGILYINDHPGMGWHRLQHVLAPNYVKSFTLPPLRYAEGCSRLLVINNMTNINVSFSFYEREIRI